ncbi:hypothetical protein GQ43DRAFT_390370 [Delitschia confertaspora ATCC 74209]|uniref:Uncharacterized protein n=1 Tax=Delitschia confertaspora ATCC 74209 TaxID=1513339 RepID=A0A9P4MXI5_9PLEO|nr:hypothetical protein GQ43DRAFT_390370 [Delitschia confertaspora ATCC 74209]
MLRETPTHVDLLILGAGWTSAFLIPLLKQENIKYAATTTTGRDNTLPFMFNPDSTDTTPYKSLPSASTILITFPLKFAGQSKLLTGLYREIHGTSNYWIQLGSSGIFKEPSDNSWITSTSPYSLSDPRAIAEDELLCLLPSSSVVLNLSGLYGGSRVPASWIPRLAKSKEDVKARNSVHFIHGSDVARAIVAVHRKFEDEEREVDEKRGWGGIGKRWVVTDLRVYDWWDLIMSFACLADDDTKAREERLQFAKWVGELMGEEGVRALPRSAELLKRKIDGRRFWEAAGIWPAWPRLA